MLKNCHSILIRKTVTKDTVGKFSVKLGGCLKLVARDCQLKKVGQNFWRDLSDKFIFLVTSNFLQVKTVTKIRLIKFLEKISNLVATNFLGDN